MHKSLLLLSSVLVLASAYAMEGTLEENILERENPSQSSASVQALDSKKVSDEELLLAYGKTLGNFERLMLAGKTREAVLAELNAEMEFTHGYWGGNRTKYHSDERVHPLSFRRYRQDTTEAYIAKILAEKEGCARSIPSHLNQIKALKAEFESPYRKMGMGDKFRNYEGVLQDKKTEMLSRYNALLTQVQKIDRSTLTPMEREIYDDFHQILTDYVELMNSWDLSHILETDEKGRAINDRVRILVLKLREELHELKKKDPEQYAKSVSHLFSREVKRFKDYYDKLLGNREALLQELIEGNEAPASVSKKHNEKQLGNLLSSWRHVCRLIANPKRALEEEEGLSSILEYSFKDEKPAEAANLFTIFDNLIKITTDPEKSDTEVLKEIDSVCGDANYEGRVKQIFDHYEEGGFSGYFTNPVRADFFDTLKSIYDRHRSKATVMDIYQKENHPRFNAVEEYGLRSERTEGKPALSNSGINGFLIPESGLITHMSAYMLPEEDAILLAKLDALWEVVGGGSLLGRSSSIDPSKPEDLEKNKETLDQLREVFNDYESRFDLHHDREASSPFSQLLDMISGFRRDPFILEDMCLIKMSRDSIGKNQSTIEFAQRHIEFTTQYPDFMQPLVPAPRQQMLGVQSQEQYYSDFASKKAGDGVLVCVIDSFPQTIDCTLMGKIASGKKHQGNIEVTGFEEHLMADSIQHGIHVAGIIASDLTQPGQTLPIGLAPNATLEFVNGNNAVTNQDRFEGTMRGFKAQHHTTPMGQDISLRVPAHEFAKTYTLEYFTKQMGESLEAPSSNYQRFLAITAPIINYCMGEDLSTRHNSAESLRDWYLSDISVYQKLLYHGNKLLVKAAGNESLMLSTSPYYILEKVLAHHSSTAENYIMVVNLDVDGVRLHPSSNVPGDDSSLKKRTLSAPGTNIASVVPKTNFSQETIAVKTGTSMASPHVSGAAALVLSNFKDLAPSQIATALLKGATPLIWVNANRFEALPITTGELVTYLAQNPSGYPYKDIVVTPEMWELSQTYYGQGRLNVDGAMASAESILKSTRDLC